MTPKVLYSVRVNVVTNISLDMVDDFMNLVGGQMRVYLKLVGDDVRPWRNVCGHGGVNRLLQTILDDPRPNLTAALQHSQNDSLTITTLRSDTLRRAS